MRTGVTQVVCREEKTVSVFELLLRVVTLDNRPTWLLITLSTQLRY